MKHILITAIILLLLSNIGLSQHVNFGIKGGLNGFTISSENSELDNLKLGLNAGVLGHIHLTKDYAFQPEIVYSGQGKDYTNGSSTRLNYINIPLNLQYMFDNGFRLQAGPQLGLLINAQLVSGNNSNDVKTNYKSTDLGVTMGISYVKPSTGYGIDFRYNHGLTNINATNSSNAFNRGVQLSVFYLFDHRS